MEGYIPVTLAGYIPNTLGAHGGGGRGGPARGIHFGHGGGIHFGHGGGFHGAHGFGHGGHGIFGHGWGGNRAARLRALYFQRHALVNGLPYDGAGGGGGGSGGGSASRSYRPSSKTAAADRMHPPASPRAMRPTPRAGWARGGTGNAAGDGMKALAVAFALHGVAAGRRRGRFYCAQRAREIKGR